MTPAEELRAAAKAMRERAEGCEPRRWHWNAPRDKRYPQQVRSDGNVTLIAECYIDPGHRPYEAEHIASWHPLVALAVADFLDAAGNDAGAAVMRDDGEPDLDWCDEPGTIVQALKIARAYLGSEAG